ADPTQRRIMFALPFVFVVFIINFQAGLIVYWITTNVWTIGQQLLVRKLYPKPPLAAAAGAPAVGGDRRQPARGKPPRAAPTPTAANGADKQEKEKPKAKAPAGNSGPAKAPPQSPRKKKKRSGRRR